MAIAVDLFPQVDILYMHTVTTGGIDLCLLQLTQSFSTGFCFAGHYAHRSGEQTANGLISEIVYREDQPMMTQLLLLPLLQQLGQPVSLATVAHAATKLSREWVQSAGLPLSKVMQISQLSPCHTVDSMIRALRTGNYTVWLSAG
ncbi:hypothetical protein LNP17_10735 [Klebsiella variicola subsp. variicola]|nr:hypothetical protein [Klebsiella variicola subsp. variicola]